MKSVMLVEKRSRTPIRAWNLRACLCPSLLSAVIASLALFWSCPAVAQSASGFIPSNRTIDWTQVGVPGGIHSANWPIVATITPSGGADDSTEIQNAINDA